MNTRIIKGGRLFPIYEGTWNKENDYLNLSIVEDNEGVLYISKKNVPKNIEITNNEYWKNYDFNPQIERYRNETLEVKQSLSNIQKSINAINDLIRLENGVSVADFGAKGDGQTDDTEAFTNALKTGKNIFIPEGFYIISSPLYVNVNTQFIKGLGSRCRIKTNEHFPKDEFVLTFYSPSGNYANRGIREQIHGNFSIECYSNENGKVHNGIRLGGLRGSEYEGHLEGQIFQNIRVSNSNIAFEYGSHVYKNLIMSCECSDSLYSVKSSDDQYDSGEVMTFLNCGFWSGCLHLKANANFISSTIHLMCQQNIDSLKCVHYFNGSFVNFTDCHFEAITRGITQSEAYQNVFYCLNGNVNFENCDGTITGSEYYVKDSFFKAESKEGNGRPSFIKINGGDWKFLFGRLKTFSNETCVLCKGNVVLNNIPWKYEFDSVNLEIDLFENHDSFETKGFINDDYIKLGGIMNDTPNFENNNLTITRSDKTQPTFGLYKIIPICNKSLCHLVYDIDLKSIMNCIVSTKNNETIYKGLYFLDANKKIINDTSINREYIFQKSCDGSTQSNFYLNQTFAIPNNTKYILYGIGGNNIINQDITLTINKLYIELA